eukprot:c21739_g6_i8.p1 GENE.c21739_g6_i8~~c21739_g6_i8.p1  ORF type:complete len:779 (+),score=375.81 c21739_g6_i8:119-2455(+)
MFGDRENPEYRGLVPRCTEHIFATILSGNGGGAEYVISSTYLEVYQEKIQDLFKPDNEDLQIREDAQNGVYVANLTREYVGNASDVYSLIAIGEASKKKCATKMNPNSSRSHCCFTLQLEITDKTGKKCRGNLNLIDLAGSEKIAKTGAEGTTLEEAKKINLSLTTLSRVIQALSEKGRAPYRESTLTRLLQNSLGGNSKTTMLVGLSPHVDNIEETLSTLRFAQSCARIQNVVKKNTILSVEELQNMLEEAKREISRLAAGGRVKVDSKDNSVQTQEGEEDELWDFDDKAKFSRNLAEKEEEHQIMEQKIQHEKDAHEMTKSKFEAKLFEMETQAERIEYMTNRIAELEKDVLSNKSAQETITKQRIKLDKQQSEILFLENQSIEYRARIAALEADADQKMIASARGHHIKAPKLSLAMVKPQEGTQNTTTSRTEPERVSSMNLKDLTDEENETNNKNKKKDFTLTLGNDTSLEKIKVALLQGDEINDNTTNTSISNNTKGERAVVSANSSPKNSARKKSKQGRKESILSAVGKMGIGNTSWNESHSNSQHATAQHAAEILSLRQRNEDLENKIGEAEIQMTNLLAEKRTLEKSVSEKDGLLKLSEATKKLLEKRLANQENLIDQLEKAKDAAEHQADQQSLLVSQLHHTETGLTKILNALEDDKKELEEKNFNLEKRIAELEIEIIKSKSVKEESSKIRVPVVQDSVLNHKTKPPEALSNIMGMFSFGSGEGDQNANPKGISNIVGSFGSLLGGTEEKKDGEDKGESKGIGSLKFW